MQNLELKAFYPHLKKAVERAEALDVYPEWTHRQVDTYYIVPDGKLKLRQVEGQTAELISYKRPAKASAKVSDYQLYSSQQGDELHDVLSHVLEVDVQVIKERTLYVWHNVRIHIDSVEQLGSFIEFEAVVGETDDFETSQKRISFLIDHFGIHPNDLLDVGYYELLKRSTLDA